MCGICGVVGSGVGGLGVSRERFVSMRDALSHRGPDDAGLYEGAGVLLGHRRLSVIDPTPAGRQPMSTGDGRYVLVYNGELYNDAALRGELEEAGVVFRTSCDTETVLHAVARWGDGAARRMRGMYALAVWDSVERVLLLGRDGFGMKPLYWAVAGGAVVFASEIPAILMHPDVSARPDWGAVSGYLTTIRTTMGERTLYAGVHAVEPGAWLRFEMNGGEPRAVRSDFGIGVRGGVGSVEEEVIGSVRAHLRSDVPWCCLLSGGLDSTVLAAVATREAGRLRTYVSGCPDAGDGRADDFVFAREAAGAIGSAHTEVPVDRGLFLERWAWMVERLGVPLSTPNEVAIYEVAASLRRDGHVVTLSGEGADELFGGYDLTLGSAESHVDANGVGRDPGFALASGSWMPPGEKASFVNAGFWRDAEEDAALVGLYADVHGGLLDDVAGELPWAGERERRLQALLRMQRRFNLVGLLGRLDTATMLASVEGRTPFADVRVATAAEGLAMDRKFVSGDPSQTKIALREAFRGMVPASIADRPKRSFPLPFEGWMGELVEAIRGSGLVEQVYSRAAVELVCADPGSLWILSWPMSNLALWGRRWD